MQRYEVVGLEHVLPDTIDLWILNGYEKRVGARKP